MPVLRARSVALTLAALLVSACYGADSELASGDARPEATSRTAQALTGDPVYQPSASALFVDGIALASGGAQATLRVGGGVANTTLVGSGTLPPLPDGSYTVTEYSLQALYGTFTVAGGVVTATSGAVTTTATGLTFDLSQLASVNIPSAMLSVPANLVQLRLGLDNALGAVSTGFLNSPTFHLPDGNYAVHDYLGEHILGTFRVVGLTVTEGTGAVVPASGGVSFNLSKLASVDVPAGTLSTPANLSNLRLGDIAAPFNGDTRFYLADGAYSLSDYGGTHVYGGFSVTGAVLGAPTGAIVVTSSGVAFALDKLAAVAIPLAAFSTPAGLERGVVEASTYLGGSAVDPVLRLPAGSYTLTDVFLEHTYGAFDVAGTAVTHASGALLVDASGHLAGNACALVGLDVTVAAGHSAVVNAATAPFSGTTRLALPAGNYSFGDAPGSSFTLAASGSISNVVLAPDVLSIGPHGCAPPPPVCDQAAPPSLTLSLSPTTLWPPNHQLVPITFTTHATASCDPAPVVHCDASSSESRLSKGSGQTTPDIAWSGGQLYLRAERNGNALGRTYTVTCTAQDAAGHITTTTGAVTVPRDR